MTYRDYNFTAAKTGVTAKVNIDFLTGDESLALTALNEVYAAAREAIEGGCKPCER